MQNLSKSWYVVYTRPRCEKRVAEQLARKKIIFYCPLNNPQRLWYDRRKFSGDPLFPSYVFVHITEPEQLRVLQTDGVISFMHWLGKPAVVRNEEVAEIKKFIDDFSEVRLEKIHVDINDHVRIIGNPVMIREGNVLEVKATTVRITLPSIGYTLVAEVNRGNAESINHLTKLEAIVT